MDPEINLYFCLDKTILQLCGTGLPLPERGELVIVKGKAYRVITLSKLYTEESVIVRVYLSDKITPN